MAKESETASASLEQVAFENRWPCRLRKVQFHKVTIPYPHYASTIEIMLVSGLSGIVSVGAEHYPIEPHERAVFFVAPNTIHYTDIQPSETGKIMVFKISLELLSVYLNIDVLLASNSHALADIPSYLPNSYEAMYDIICNRISYTGDAYAMLEGVVALFRYLDAQISKKANHPAAFPTNPKICEIITWMENHFSQPVTVEDAAKELHYSKYHFCKIFKESVGISFLQYLNILRINHAIRLMENGKTATECCYECGFQSLSHFLKLFKKSTGYTTNQYRKFLSEPIDSQKESRS